MAIDTQRRIPLGQTVQQANASALATVLALQAITVTAAATQNLERDLHRGDTTAGSFTITLLPGAQWPAFKPYSFQKVAAANTLTIAAASGELIEGAASVALTADSDMLTIFWDSVSGVFRRGSPALSGAAPANMVSKTDVSDMGPVRLDLIGANADEIRFAPSFGGTITVFSGISSEASVATGTAIATLSIGGTPVTGGALTWDIADPAGTLQTTAPSAANVFEAGDEIRILVSGTNDAAAFAGFTIGYTRT